MNAVQQLKATGKVSRGQLGVQMQGMDRDAASALGLPDANGALVATVEPGSAAERAGLQRQDVIRSVNGQRVYESSDLPPIIGAMAPGAKVTLEVIRDGKPRTLSVMLGALDEGVAAAGGEAGGGSEPATPALANPLGIVGQELTAAAAQRHGPAAEARAC